MEVLQKLLKILDFVLKEKIDVTIVGPESSLEVGIVNLFRSRNLKIFGPTKEAALIETSKDFAKKLMVDNDIPTADYKTFDSYADAKEHIRLIKFPCVIKADGLASGKGVVIANTYDEANRFLYEQMIEEKFGIAGKKVIIEEFLIGEEVSVFTFVDGKNISNPIATILSFSMALKYSLGLEKESSHLDKAVEKTLEDGLRTPDIMSKGKKKVSTSDMGDAIISNLN